MHKEPDFSAMPVTDERDLSLRPDDHEDALHLRREHWEPSSVRPDRHSHTQQRPERASVGLVQVSEAAKRASHHVLLSLSTDHSTETLRDAYLLSSSPSLPDARSSDVPKKVKHLRESVANFLEGLEAIATIPYHSDKRMSTVTTRFNELGKEFMDLTAKMAHSPSPDKEIYTALRGGIAHIRQVGFEFGLEEALQKRALPRKFQDL